MLYAGTSLMGTTIRDIPTLSMVRALDDREFVGENVWVGFVGSRCGVVMSASLGSDGREMLQ